jgi:hypothetical protein
VKKSNKKFSVYHAPSPPPPLPPPLIEICATPAA